MTHSADGDEKYWESIKDGIAGLGERSIRKSYYPELKSKIRSLDRQRNFFQSTLNSIPVGVVVMDANGQIIQGNPALCAMFGYANEELVGRKPSFLYGEHAETFNHGDLPFTLCRCYADKDGKVFIGETIDSEIRDDQGELLGHLEVIRDLSERLSAIERQRDLEEHLRQSQKMAAIGTLAGGIAHDFNNLLAAIIGYAELALLKIPRESPQYHEIDQILKAGCKASELVKQILTFSRKESVQQMPLRPGPLVKEVLKLLRGTIPSTIAIREQIAMTDRLILADPTQLHQVVMNLCTNAFHAMEERGGVMSLCLEVVRDQGGDGLDGRECIRLSVSDTGTGIAPEHLERIFEPYFTTKASGKGTGMGLAVVHGIVENHGGKIGVESALGKGTTFHVTFPVVSGEAPQPRAFSSVNLAGGKESILLVDDELMVVDYLKGFLEQLGYQVTTCNDGITALTLFERNPDSFDLVITDQTMPGKTGFEMARIMLTLRPQLPIVLCSGYSAAISLEKVLNAGIRKFMMKPVTLYDLAASIREVLAR